MPSNGSEICEVGTIKGIEGIDDADDEGLRAATPATRVDSNEYEYYVYTYFDQYSYINIVEKYSYSNTYPVAHFWFFGFRS